MKYKYYYDDEYIKDFSKKLAHAMPDFQQEAFSDDLLGRLDDKELFDRFDCIVDAMEKCMGSDYSKIVEAFFRILGPELEKAEGMFNVGWWLWSVSRYVERHGNEAWQLSLAFLKELTKRFTGEYAIRPLLKEHPAEVMDELDDPEKFVQKSVGNNLNDLYKEAPEKAESIIAQWRKAGESKASAWIIKHGMRNQKS